MAFVTLPELEVQAVRQTYRTVSVLDGEAAVVAFSWDDFAAELVVDGDGLVISYPGVAARLTSDQAAAG
jgi:hypothetical protein